VRAMPDGDGEEDITSGAGGVYKKLIRAGLCGGHRPPPGADVTVHYQGYLVLSGQKFDSSRDRDEEFQFKLGVGQVIEGWDIAVATMVPGELAIFTCRADYAYGWEGKPPKIPVDATLRFEIELIGWEPAAKPVADMTPAEKLAHGTLKREEGTALLKADDHAAASDAFSAAIESLSALHFAMSAATPDPAKLEVVTAALRSCLLNHSQCCLKLERWDLAVSHCTAVLRLEPNVAKALFRRGVALVAIERFDEGMADLKAACKLEPKSREVRDAYDRAKAALSARKQAEREAFGGIFSAGTYGDRAQKQA